MSNINKSLLRLAIAIHAELASHRRERAIELPVWSWNRCVDLVRQIRRAELRSWQLAADELRRDLSYTIPTLQSELAAIAAQLPRAAATLPSTLASTSDIYQDLVAFESEFDDLQFDVRERWLSVTTEPITLNDTFLGPFEIRLEWSRCGADQPYRVIAKEPHPAESRDNVTHPHVMDELLCEGHSRQMIRQSLAQGRLLDFFTLIGNGLRTYNDESPFVALEIWHGATCSDCGAVVDEDDRYVCQRCEETICENCASTCAECGDSCCSQCSSGCAVCDENLCTGCLRTCRGCRRYVCRECLATVQIETDQAIGRSLAQQVLQYPIGTLLDRHMLRDFQNHSIRTLMVKDERCVSCHEKEQTDSETCSTQAADRAAVYAHGMGQALVPA